MLWCALMKVLFHRSDCVFLLSGVLVISRIVVMMMMSIIQNSFVASRRCAVSSSLGYSDSKFDFIDQT